MKDWFTDAVFYHVYPLGYCGAPSVNDFSAAPVARLDKLSADLDRIKDLGCNALYLGPLFESVAHGYDPVDWRTVDRRLGTKEDLVRLAREAKARGMRLVFDAVFNHTGREHPWFQALRARGAEAPSSPEAARYVSVGPGSSPCGDGFMYEGWAGHYDLAKLNLRDRETAQELIDAALSWIEDYDIDGIRLDTADCLDSSFLEELAAACRARKSGFWLMGEIVGGDYRKWAGRESPGGGRSGGPLDSVTNYECYKGLWSSLVDVNYFEIAWSLKRQFGDEGIYRGLPLYSFADNHDVDRVASKLAKEEQLYPLYCLLFTMPGIPSIYYGSETGAKGKKDAHSDAALRPTIEEALASGSQPDLQAAIRRLAGLREAIPALRRGGYRELHVAHEQLAFERSLSDGALVEATGARRAVVALNASAKSARVELRVGGEGEWRDALNEGGAYRARGGILGVELPPCWARVMVEG